MLFPKNQSYFKIRFILDVYHIALFELNGVYVSDYYLQNNFEKIFTSKFLEYENQQRKNKKNLSALLNKNEKVFLGRKVTYPVIFNHEGGMDFADELINKLKIHKRSPRRYGLATGLAADHKTSQTNKINDFEEAAHLADSKTNQEEAKKINETIVGHIIHNQELKEKEDMKKKVIMALNTKKKFNCIQVSPTFSQVLNMKNMSLPFKKRKLINHSIDKLYMQNKDYREMFEEIYSRRKNTKENKTSVRPKSISQKSILKNYGDLKIEYDEKAKKYPKLFQDMEDLKEVLNIHNGKFSDLASSKQTLEDYKKHNILKFDEIKKEAETEIQRRIAFHENPMSPDNHKTTTYIAEETSKTENASFSKNIENTEENKLEEVEGRKRISTMFKLPMIANKMIQNSGIGKKNFSRSRTKNLSESTAASLIKNEEEYNPENYQKKIHLNVIIEEKGQNRYVVEEDHEKNDEIDSQLFTDKRRDYFKKYRKVVNGSHDENIDEIINKIMVKQNSLTKKLISGFKSKKNLNMRKSLKPKLDI